MMRSVEELEAMFEMASSRDIPAVIRLIRREAIKAALEAAAQVALRHISHDGSNAAILDRIRAIDPESLMGGGT